MSFWNNTEVGIGSIVNKEQLRGGKNVWFWIKRIHTCMYLCTLFFFLRVWRPSHMHVRVFPPHSTPHTRHLLIGRAERTAHRMGWVRKRGRERRQAGPVPTGLTHGSALTTKTPAPGHGTPVGGSDTCTNTDDGKHIGRHTCTQTRAVHNASMIQTAGPCVWRRRGRNFFFFFSHTGMVLRIKKKVNTRFCIYPDPTFESPYTDDISLYCKFTAKMPR